ncbi:PAS domain-containing protein [Bradyrhizobium sp. G127]|jgi:PAS domain-containing protein|uniref:PAS domain-containing protein n=1 Tax=Bradyrhizobium sp. G127 TaxID=2904800 RepID=UPI001F40308F|nr:PAS domain-containing protein [Bradyrhizobium sp. G127]MCF2521267.1 PAS domain-containing protein [Bradyrhizobium sp. G127]
MAIEVFNGTSIPRELATAAMEFLWAKWKTLNDTNDLNVERLTEECSYELRANSIHMVSVGDDFAYVYVGEAIKAAARERLSGCLLSQLTNPLKGEFGEVYRQVAKRMSPAFIRYTGGRSQSGKVWQRLILPIKVTESTVMLVIYSELISYQIEVYEHLFRTAPDAMIIASPISNDVGHTVDGWIVMMNDRARQLLGFDGSIGNLRLTQLPQFAGVDIWGRLYAPKSAAAVTPVTTADFNVEILRFPRVFGLRISPKAGKLDAREATLVPDSDANPAIQPA